MDLVFPANLKYFFGKATNKFYIAGIFIAIQKCHCLSVCLCDFHIYIPDSSLSVLRGMTRWIGKLLPFTFWVGHQCIYYFDGLVIAGMLSLDRRDRFLSKLLVYPPSTKTRNIVISGFYSFSRALP